jgi:hypothetical protein
VGVTNLNNTHENSLEKFQYEFPEWLKFSGRRSLRMD